MNRTASNYLDSLTVANSGQDYPVPSELDCRCVLVLSPFFQLWGWKYIAPGLARAFVSRLWCQHMELNASDILVVDMVKQIGGQRKGGWVVVRWSV